MGGRAHLVLQVFRALKVYKDHREFVDLQDQWVRLVNLVRLVLVANEVTEALVENQDLLDRMALSVRKDSAVKLASVAQWAPRVDQGQKDLLALRGNLVILVQMVNLGRLDLVDHRENVEHQDKWDLLVRQAGQAQKEHLVPLDQKVPKVNVVRRESWEKVVQLGFLDPSVTPEYAANVVTKVSKENWDQEENLDR